MIELGKIVIKDETAILEARNKIRILAEDLNFGAIGSTKLATITSELSRMIHQEGDGSSIAVILEKQKAMIEARGDSEETYGLKLIFQSRSKDLPIKGAYVFFDEVKTIQTEDGLQHIEAVKFIPDTSFRPSEEFVKAEQEKLTRVSKAELFREVQRKNKELLAVLDELKMKNIELETATRLKSEFLANMSHELRTPLNSIIGFSGRVIKKAGDLLPEKHLKNLNIVLRNAHHLLDLINSLLDISKIEAGKMDVFPEEFRLSPLITEVFELTRGLAADKGLELKKDIPDEPIFLYTDKIKLKQILINLVSNAVKFTEKGSVALRVRKGEPSSAGTRSPSAQEMDYVTICVRDSGVGIRPEEMKYIFDEFRQVDGSTTRTAGGTGLGLSIAKKFTDLLNGEIDVASVRGEGSTFTVTIPTRVADMPERPEKEPVKEIKMPEPSKEGLTILCIDDNPEVLELLHGYLTDEGYKVIMALDGDDGVKKAEELKPFAITLDIQMPYKDGWTVLRELKSNKATMNIPVVIVSIMDNVNLGYNLGAFGYLQKPIQPEVLLGTIDRILRRRAQTILVVDDDPDVIDMMRQILEEEKIHVRAAENGVKALESMQEIIPDLVLLDLMMPEMDGFEVINHMRNNKEWAEIPVIIITAKVLTDKEITTLEKRAQTIILKAGINTDDVLKEIAEAMKKLPPPAD